MNPLFLSLPSHTKHMPASCLRLPTFSHYTIILSSATHVSSAIIPSLLLSVFSTILFHCPSFSNLSALLSALPIPSPTLSCPYQKLELHRASIHDRKRLSYELTSSCASRLLFLGQVHCIAHMLQHGGVFTICQLYCSLMSFLTSWPCREFNLGY